MGVTYTTATGATYVPLAITTTTGSVASVTLSSISAAYTDIVAVINLTGTSTGYLEMTCQFNGDTTSNYSVTSLEGNGTSAVSQRQSTQSQMYMAGFQYATYTAPYTVIASINNYSNSTTYKTLLTRCSANTAGAYVGLWRATPAAINSWKFIMGSSGTFNTGSTFALYGILGA